MDEQAIAALMNPDGDFAHLREILTTARKEASAYLGVDDTVESIPSGCATVLSILLQRSGINIPIESGAGKLARLLESRTGQGRGWNRIAVGYQKPGDVGVTFDLTSPPGADHIFLVVRPIDASTALVADNQRRELHPRSLLGGPKTPTAYLLRPQSRPTVTEQPSLSAQTIAAIFELVDKSGFQHTYEWPGRDHAPRGYLLGMAVGYALVCRRLGSDPTVQAMAQPVDFSRQNTDALAIEADRFAQAGLPLDDKPATLLRRLYVLLTGLGMRESSGVYCTGVYAPDKNFASDTAEAGLFQASYNLVSGNREYEPIRARYFGSTDLRTIFSDGIACKPDQLKNWGDEPNGVEFQRLTKDCPAFAIEIALLGLRNRARLWGPLRQRSVTLSPEWDAILQSVETLLAMP